MTEENNQDCCQNGGCKSFKMKHLIILLAILGFIAMGIVSVLRERIVNQDQYQVSFSASGRAFAKPDIAQIQLAVKTDRQKDAVTAVKSNTDKMNAVIAKIKSLGVEEKDIKTTSYNLSPEYDYTVNVGRGVLAGYSIYQEVTLKIRDLDKVGKIIEQATSAGANQIGNISFTIDDLDAIKKQAREEAVAKAKVKAEEMAKLTGIHLGKLINVYENSGSVPVADYGYANKSMALGMGGGAEVAMPAPEIQTGQNEINLEVTLVYEVR
ncbi:MAG: SIMPL domain-containing protein [Candidatus Komeilibacteria bacterium]|nr:SIMPL domain-containing protein [Candidatus Komeilibacteria bacterium]